ncbi:MAG TPA: biotin/lipoate A/B protein ligase family protein [Aestuariivirga sp.]|nr:biotin/lipoate A/B protein ligase family protein [Aestuariivirga sp.]
MKPFRVIDTGVRDGRAQIAFDQALIDLHHAGAIGDTIRFLTFRPTVLVGRHQAISQELHLDACRSAGVGIGRRITGGGALYLDEQQFGWELIFHRNTLGIASLADLTRLICEAAAHGLSKLGIDARYRPRNDIEVGGRKISGTGGFFDGDTLFYQGTVLGNLDPELMLRLLNIPEAKRARHAAAGPRVVTLHELFDGAPPPLAEVKRVMLEGFAEKLGISPRREAITDREEELARQIHDDEIGTDGFVYEIDDPGAHADVLVGEVQSPGGMIAAHVRLEGKHEARYREVIITGDFFVTPPRTIFDLEATLRGTRVADTAATVTDFFRTAGVGMLTVRPEDFTAALLAAVSVSA